MNLHKYILSTNVHITGTCVGVTKHTYNVDLTGRNHTGELVEDGTEFCRVNLQGTERESVK
jgi:hypothetical protein